MAVELSRKNWKLGFSDGKAMPVRQVTIKAGDLKACREEIEKAKQKFGVIGDVAVRSCYEAGREGFGLHRTLIEMGIENEVVDASSIEVNRRQRRAKTDRMDVEKLVSSWFDTLAENKTFGEWCRCQTRKMRIDGNCIARWRR